MNSTVRHRRLGELAIDIEVPEELGPLVEAWLGCQGWDDGSGGIPIAIRRSGGHWRITGIPKDGRKLHGTAEWVLSELEFGLARLALRESPAPAALHAAVLETGGRSVIIAGPHGSGKTTLALAMNNAGVAISGDDIAVLSADGQVRALPRPLRIKPPSHQLLSTDQQHRALFDEVEGLYRIDPIQVNGLPASWCKVDAVLFVGFQRELGSVSLSHIDSGAAIDELVRHTFDCKPRTGSTLEAVVELVARARCARITYGGQPQLAASRVIEFLETKP